MKQRVNMCDGRMPRSYVKKSLALFYVQSPADAVSILNEGSRRF